MDITGARQKISKAALLLGNLNQSRGRYVYIILFIITLIAASAVLATYFFQKSEITKKENILKSYFDREGELALNLPGAAGNVQEVLQDGNTYKGEGSIDKKSGSQVTTEDPVTGDKNASYPALTEKNTLIKVYICGCVNQPGVYEMALGSRIVDLAGLCGGFTEDACTEAVNLAAILSDEEKVYIPSKTEISQQGINLLDGVSSGNNSSGKQEQTAGSQGQKVNINSASAEELMVLPGIGEQIAKNIIDYRNQYGAFSTKEELKNVKGIGEKKFEQIKELVSI
jgi:competence protein ComEA